MFGRKTIILLTFMFFNAIEFSKQLYSEPDLSNPLIPLNVRQMCGYRYRPQQRNITFNKKCFKYSFEDKVVFSPYVVNHQNNVIPSNRVLDGKDVEYREAPWVVQFGDSGFISDTNICSGVLITMRHILTAAHCHPAQKNQIFVGNDKSFSALRISGFKFIKHPNYTKTNRGYDIAVVRLDTPLNLDLSERNSSNKLLEINTICLPLLEKSHDISNKVQDATFFGWGRTAQNTPSKTLQRADFRIKYCEFFRKMCFETTSDTYPKTCSGDSGGGLLQYLGDGRAVLIGIMRSAVNKTNQEPFCGQEHIGRSIFIRVVRHIDWINKQLTEN